MLTVRGHHPLASIASYLQGSFVCVGVRCIMFRIKINHQQLAKVMKVSDIDFLLIVLVVNLIKKLGHRYGRVIDAVSMAAKFTVYLTYLEEGKNLRRTGFLHHVEPRRVKEIVSEFEALVENGETLHLLGSVEPSYLIGFSYIWAEHFPMKPGESRLKLFNLTMSERLIVEASINTNIPECLAIHEEDLHYLIKELHEKSQASLPLEKRIAFSDALGEHAKFRLLESGTVKEIKLAQGPSAYILAKKDYSPRDRQARIHVMIQDLTRYFEGMYAWVDEEPEVMRGIETLGILPEDKDAAFQELDQLVRDWADKYHSESATNQVALQFLLSRHMDILKI